MSDKIEVSVCDGKYVFTFENGSLICKRYGEEWRDFIGDKAVLCLVMELADARYALKQTSSVIENILTDSQLDQRTECGKTIRRWSSVIKPLLNQDTDYK